MKNAAVKVPRDSLLAIFRLVFLHPDPAETICKLAVGDVPPRQFGL